MKKQNLLKGAALTLFALSSVSVFPQQKTNAGLAYLLSQTKDMSQDFLDFSNTYFFADSLVSIDPATGKGIVQWKRHQLQPRQAFNANTIRKCTFPKNGKFLRQVYFFQTLTAVKNTAINFGQPFRQLHIT